MATLIPSFDLAERIGQQVEIDAADVAELIRVGTERFGAPFAEAAQRAALLVNGRSVQHLKGHRTRLTERDVVWMVLPSSGG